MSCRPRDGAPPRWPADRSQASHYLALTTRQSCPEQTEDTEPSLPKQARSQPLCTQWLTASTAGVARRHIGNHACEQHGQLSSAFQTLVIFTILRPAVVTADGSPASRAKARCRGDDVGVSSAVEETQVDVCRRHVMRYRLAREFRRWPHWPFARSSENGTGRECLSS